MDLAEAPLRQQDEAQALEVAAGEGQDDRRAGASGPPGSVLLLAAELRDLRGHVVARGLRLGLGSAGASARVRRRHPAQRHAERHEERPHRAAGS